MHSFEPGFQITCGCARTYTNFRTFQKHLIRQHQAAFEKNTTDDSTADSQVLEEEIPLNIDASPIVTTEEERSSLKQSAVLFLLKTKEVHRVTQTALNGIIEGVTELFQSHAGSSTVKPFAGLESRYLQEKFYEEVFHLVVSDNFV